MSIQILTPSEDDAVKSLFLLSSKLLGTSQTFINDAVNTHFNPASAYYNKELNREMLLLLENDTTLIGFIGIDHNKKEIQHLVIHPDKRGQGNGSMLMRETAKRYPGYVLSCLGSNEVAIKFYNRLDCLMLDKITQHFSKRDHCDYSLLHYSLR